MNALRPLPSLSSINELERLILSLPQVDLPITHEFCDGLYARTMFIPEGTILTGAIHRSENFLVIRSGDITIWTDEGVRRFTAGELVKSLEGVKRVGYAHSDTLLTTFHANPVNETDPETLWEMYAVDETSELGDEVILIEVEQ